MLSEKLKERLVQLEAQLREADAAVQAALNQGQAIHGAIQECQYWLEKVKEAEDGAESSQG